MFKLDSRLEEKKQGTKILHCGDGLTYRDLCELYKDYYACGNIITNRDISLERFSWGSYDDRYGESSSVWITFQDGSYLPLWLIESDNFEVEFYVGEVE